MSKYNASDFEKKTYALWKDAGLFELGSNAKISNNKSFALLMPPPNVTGVLHIGHSLTFNLQDIIVRYKRMQGYHTLYQPGLDHAGIATQNIVEKQLLAAGSSKEELGRERFIERVWEWKEKSGSSILGQMEQLGISPAFSRLRFTMDEGMSLAVKNAFKELYDKGLIEQDFYMVNWCTHCGAISDIEVEYEENKGFLYHIRYYLADTKGEGAKEDFDSTSQESIASKNSTSRYIIISTTRPETLFGDTAIMVHPDDERYKDLVGKSVLVPIINRSIKVIADSHVDMEFGTGCVKVTPSHDVNDYAVGKRHGLEFITCFSKDGILNKEAGIFVGRERLEARDAIVEYLKEHAHIEGIDPYENNIGTCYRCHNVIEPYISKQWFIKKEIAHDVIEKVAKASSNGKQLFYPNNWINNFNAWMSELKPWCISRQLWWGHRIPVFYCKECLASFVSVSLPECCEKCGSRDIYQDEDVLDTWFSSALFSFTTLGWGNYYINEAGEKVEVSKELYNRGDLEEFYPNSLLITGFDILFFWVARMLFAGDNLLGSLPFHDIYLHALVRDEHGHKMSKSRGNVIDPLEMIDRYSSDILRFTLCQLCAQGRDIRLAPSELVVSRNFTNKLVNALAFLQMYKQQQDEAGMNAEDAAHTPLGIYARIRMKSAIASVQRALEEYRFNDASLALYRFFWNEFCDEFIEYAKVSKSSVYDLIEVMKEGMRALHPFMPFISEYIYQSLEKDCKEGCEPSFTADESIMIKRYPSPSIEEVADITGASLKECDAIEHDFALIKEALTSLRRLKITLGLGEGKIEAAHFKAQRAHNSELIRSILAKLGKAQTINLVLDGVGGHDFSKGYLRDIGQNIECLINIANIDLGAIRARLDKEGAKLEKEVAKLENMLGNENFIARAPKEVLEGNKGALSAARERLGKIKEELRLLEDA